MSETKPKRLSKVAREFNVATTTIIETLNKEGIDIDTNPNTKILPEVYDILLKRFDADKADKEKSQKVKLPNLREENKPEPTNQGAAQQKAKTEAPEPSSKAKTPGEERPQYKVVGKIDLNDLPGKKPKSKPKKPVDPPEHKAPVEEKEQVEQQTPTPEDETVPVPEQEKPEEAPEPAPVQTPDATEETSAPVSEEAKEKTPAPAEPAQAAGEDEVEKPAPDAQKGEEQPEEPPARPEPEASKEKPAASEETPEKASDFKEEEKPAPEQEDAPEAEATEPTETASEETPAQAEASASESGQKTPEEQPPADEHKQETTSSSTTSSQGEAKTDEKGNKLQGLTILGKINLEDTKPKRKPVASSTDPATRKKRRRRKIVKDTPEEQKPATQAGGAQGGGPARPGPASKGGPAAPQKGKRKAAPRKEKTELDEKQIQEQIKATLNRLDRGGKGKQKLKRQKREQRAAQREAERAEEEATSNIIEVTEFITANELASIMEVPVTDVITTCMNLGVMVSINQRLDAETIDLVSEEFGYKVEFKDVELTENFEDEEDEPSQMQNRPPVVTIMGHVDHGKTSLLDFIRKSKIIAGEAGGITQHIGAYEVKLDNDKMITFLDTPGHEAFTAMRARGAQVTDVVIIVIAADDSVMPQTKEAISHAQAAGVPIVFAYNKVDKETANVERLRSQLAEMNVLVEEYGGKYQTQEISAKFGQGVDELLEKVVFEAEVLELKANPEKRANGTVVEAALEKGRGIVSTVLVQAGTLRIGDPMIAGASFGRVKAMFNERGQKVKEAGPSQPVQVLGLDEAPNSGEKFYVPADESLAKGIAVERKQLLREQGIRATKHITLDEIGRRIAIGNFKELNVIVKGDVDGSVEALSDSLLNLSTEEIQVNVIHKGVGQITESDVLLASASDAIILGFQVRPSPNARRIAEQEQIDIRLYSVIYDAIEEIKAAMEGMLSPEIKEEIRGYAEVRETFKISKVGTVAGCYITEGKIARNDRVRLVRDGVVVHTGSLDALKRYKDDVKEVATGYECGMKFKDYNDIKIGDTIEAFTQVEVSRTL